MVVPSNDSNLLLSTGNAAQSPFVIAAKRAGIKVVPSIINFVVLTSAWSSGNSGEYLRVGKAVTKSISAPNSLRDREEIC